MNHTKSKLVNFKLTEKYYEWLEQLADHGGFEGNKSAWLRAQILKAWKDLSETLSNQKAPVLRGTSSKGTRKQVCDTARPQLRGTVSRKGKAG